MTVRFFVVTERDAQALVKEMNLLPEGVRVLHVYGGAAGHWAICEREPAKLLQSVQTPSDVNVTVAVKPALKKGK